MIDDLGVYTVSVECMRITSSDYNGNQFHMYSTTSEKMGYFIYS